MGGERVLRALRAVQGDESLVDADAPPPTVDLPEIRRLVGSTPWATAWSALASHLSRPASSEEIAAIRAELSGLRRWGDEWKVWIADTDLSTCSDIVQRANVKASAMEGALPALEALPNLEWLDLYGDDDEGGATRSSRRSGSSRARLWRRRSAGWRCPPRDRAWRP